MNLEERFWSKIDVRKKDDCWEWKRGSRGNGYGCFKYDGKVIDSHRMVWFLIYGEFPELLVCHTCDNRKCCNPNHLFLGTYKDNVDDMMEKGRHGAKKGELNPLYKPLVHGTLNGYKHKKCRCDKCQKANAIERRKYRRSQ